MLTSGFHDQNSSDKRSSYFKALKILLDKCMNYENK